jgi:hypothetical protein
MSCCSKHSTASKDILSMTYAQHNLTMQPPLQHEFPTGMMCLPAWYFAAAHSARAILQAAAAAAARRGADAVRYGLQGLIIIIKLLLLLAPLCQVPRGLQGRCWLPAAL